MYNDFIVKVYRYWEDNNDSRSWDGWYYSKVYAIDGNEFLVYDNGDMSAYNGEEDFCETGFNWVDFTATMDICGENGRQPIVEPLVPFDIVEFMADRKTEPTISKMEQVDKDINVRSKTEPQTNADQHVQHVESVKDETGHWVRVGQWEWEHHTDTTHFGKTKGESITTNKVEDEPQTERSSE